MKIQIPKCIKDDADCRRIIYLRYADDFVVMVRGSKKDAEQIKDTLGEFIRSNCGMELNTEKTSIVNTREGFNFLGVGCKRRDTDSVYGKDKGVGEGLKRRGMFRLALNAPIKRIMEKFIKFGYARRNHKKIIIAKGVTSIIHQDHGQIISFFNSKMRGILSAYSFVGNFTLMVKLVRILQQSCALTLARKLKLKTMRKTFSKFGLRLEDPATGLKLNYPESYKATNNYGELPNFTHQTPDVVTERTIRPS